jgi:hypothetical protein
MTKMGMVSGIMPGERTGDALILQYLNNVAFDYDKVQTCTPMAGGILWTKAAGAIPTRRSDDSFPSQAIMIRSGISTLMFSYRGFSMAPSVPAA